jgi:superfamily II DNA or RNA helicase
LPLRKYQQDIIDLCNTKLASGERELHIVAPPGSGKTIIGLQIVSQFKCPTLVLCPNTTIQSQWGQKLSLFFPADYAEMAVAQMVGTHEDRPLRPITIVTYQALSVPGREQDYIAELAMAEWVKEISREQSMFSADATLRIAELKENNSKAYKKEIGRHATRLRKRLTDVLDLEQVLHKNALDLIAQLKNSGCGLVIFDECHHLTDYWAAVMTKVVEQLGSPTIVGLTGTPPEKKTAAQHNRYLNLVGPIDYQVPTPALVKEGGLAPFQDLVLFTEPTEIELEFLRQQHREIHELLDQLSGPVPEPSSWQYDDLQIARLPLVKETSSNDLLAVDGYEYSTSTFETQPAANVSAAPDVNGSATSDENVPAKLSENVTPRLNLSPLSQWIVDRMSAKTESGWNEFVEQSPHLALAMSRYLFTYRLPLPAELEFSMSVRQAPVIDDWICLLEDYALNKLKVSDSPLDHEMLERISKAVRKIGFGLSERGIRKIASPVDRVLSFSESKVAAVAKILNTEFSSLEDKLRALVITDFEKLSATNAASVKDVLDADAGSAFGAFAELLKLPEGACVNPCLVTGSRVLIDQRIASEFLEAAQNYLKEQQSAMTLSLETNAEQGFSRVIGDSSGFVPRVYVSMVTALFERGITKCLIGTRGIFGEGWDSQKLNTIIDLTTATSPVSVKQLRGRGIRLNVDDPLAERKVANNWDVVCIAPELEKGLNDYRRFVRKHDGYFGIADDGKIECGVGHVHPSFSDLTPNEVFVSIEDYNREMLQRALVRDKIYELWQVGMPYENKQLGCVEISGLRQPGVTPAHVGTRGGSYKKHVAEMRSELKGISTRWGALGLTVTVASTMAASAVSIPVILGAVPLIIALIVAKFKREQREREFEQELAQPSTRETTIKAMAEAVLDALKERKLLPANASAKSIQVTVRADKTFRVFLDDVEPRYSDLFIRCLEELLAPISNQPYVIPKYEFETSECADTKLFYQRYIGGHAEAAVCTYHAVPKILARSEKGREAFELAWNEHVSPGFVTATEDNPQLLQKYFGMGPSLSERLLWE